MLSRLIIFLLCLGFFLPGDTFSHAGESNQDLPETEFRHLHYYLYEKGQLKWQIEALKAWIYRGRKIDLEKVIVSSGDRQLKIMADRGVYNIQQDRFVFEGNVLLETSAHGRLETTRLVYLPRAELLKTDSSVRIEHQGVVMEGEGFIYDLRTGTFKILHQTRVRLNG